MDNYSKYFEIGGLIAKYLQGNLDVQEKELLDNWLASDERNRQILTKLTDEIMLEEELSIFSSLEKEQAWEEISVAAGIKKSPRSAFAARHLLRYAAALLFLLILGLFINHYQVRNARPLVIARHDHEILPGSNKAILTLANGSQIVLNNSQNGTIASEQNTIINKTRQGQIIYQAKAIGERRDKVFDGKVIAFNMITTPRGGQYQVVLPDGTRVWLNAASSLRYPVVFDGNTRRVDLTGEAYFEVAKNAAKPFLVATTDQTVEVLGTHFNINSYADENATKTTLLEGSVKVSRRGMTKVVRLAPGQQAINAKTTITIIENADTEEAVAWKNGKFLFRNTDLHNIMRQLSRWYDVDVKFKGAIAERHYKGQISRNVPLWQLFEILKTSGINFTIDGRTIIVTS